MEICACHTALISPALVVTLTDAGLEPVFDELKVALVDTTDAPDAALIPPVTGWPPARPSPLRKIVTVVPGDARFPQLITLPPAFRAKGSRLSTVSWLQVA
jgi:hypothetical protein